MLTHFPMIPLTKADSPPIPDIFQLIMENLPSPILIILLILGILMAFFWFMHLFQKLKETIKKNWIKLGAQTTTVLFTNLVLIYYAPSLVYLYIYNILMIIYNSLESLHHKAINPMNRPPAAVTGTQFFAGVFFMVFFMANGPMDVEQRH